MVGAFSEFIVKENASCLTAFSNFRGVEKLEKGKREIIKLRMCSRNK